MGHRKYSAPRHGSLSYLPKKRSRSLQGRIGSFPVDTEKESKPHFTAFLGFKAGMTQVLRTLNLRNSDWDGKDIVEAATIVETPPLVVVGIVGYIETPKGIRCFTTVWGPTLGEEIRRKFYKNWVKSKKKAFHRYIEELQGSDSDEIISSRLKKMKKLCSIIRVIAHTQPAKINSLAQKKANLLEIQINGGTIEQKVDFAQSYLGKEISIHDVFSQNENVDTISVTKGYGQQGVISRWGVSILSRKSHRGARKVACIGAWHPANVSYTIGRNGQKGYHHRTEVNKKIYRIGRPVGFVDENGKRVYQAKTKYDLTEKDITPRGGFPSYGEVKNSFILFKGSIGGPSKRPITIRKSFLVPGKIWHSEAIDLKWIDTSSTQGRTNFQTSAEKIKYYGLTKVQKELQNQDMINKQAALNKNEISSSA